MDCDSGSGGADSHCRDFSFRDPAQEKELLFEVEPAQTKETGAPEKAKDEESCKKKQKTGAEKMVKTLDLYKNDKV